MRICLYYANMGSSLYIVKSNDIILCGIVYRNQNVTALQFTYKASAYYIYRYYIGYLNEFIKLH